MKIPNRVKLLLTLVFFITLAAGFSIVYGATNSTSTTTPAPSIIGIPIEGVIFLGAFLGVVARTFLPYLAKARAASALPATTPASPAFTFDKHFLYTAIIGVVQSAVITVLLFQGIPPLQGFFAAFTYGYSTQDAINNQL